MQLKRKFTKKWRYIGRATWIIDHFADGKVMFVPRVGLWYGAVKTPIGLATLTYPTQKAAKLGVLASLDKNYKAFLKSVEACKAKEKTLESTLASWDSLDEETKATETRELEDILTGDYVYYVVKDEFEAILKKLKDEIFHKMGLIMPEELLHRTCPEFL